MGFWLYRTIPRRATATFSYYDRLQRRVKDLILTFFLQISLCAPFCLWQVSSCHSGCSIGALTERGGTKEIRITLQWFQTLPATRQMPQCREPPSEGGDDSPGRRASPCQMCRKLPKTHTLTLSRLYRAYASSHGWKMQAPPHARSLSSTAQQSAWSLMRRSIQSADVCHHRASHGWLQKSLFRKEKGKSQVT